MELRNIFTFLTAAEIGNFSKTAETLGYSPSAVTMQIQQLEEELGKPLFDRFNRSIKLTAFGKECLPLARKISNTVKELQSLSVEPKDLTGTLNIGIVESLLFSGLLKLVNIYESTFPKVLLDFHTTSSARMAELIMKNKLDLGIYLVSGENSLPLDPLLVLYACPVPLVFVVNSNHPLANIPVCSIEQIENEEFVLTESVSAYQTVLRSVFDMYKRHIKESIRIGSTQGVIELLKYSNKISFLPEYAVHQEVEAGVLKIVNIDLPRLENQVVVVVHKGKWISPQMQGMIDLLKTRIESVNTQL